MNFLCHLAIYQPSKYFSSSALWLLSLSLFLWTMTTDSHRSLRSNSLLPEQYSPSSSSFYTSLHSTTTTHMRHQVIQGKNSGDLFDNLLPFHLFPPKGSRLFATNPCDSISFTLVHFMPFLLTFSDYIVRTRFLVSIHSSGFIFIQQPLILEVII